MDARNLLLWVLASLLCVPVGAQAQYVRTALPGPARESFGVDVDFNDTDPFNIVVGAPNADDFRGAAYVFQQRGVGIWALQQRLTASDAGAGGVDGDQFGWAVAISGNHLVVGAPSYDCPGLVPVKDCGKAYIFERSFDTWSEVAILEGSDTGHLDRFGHAVAISGLIFGGLGERHAVIGAPFGAAAYVFRPDVLGVWQQQARLTASDARPFSNFGGSVGINRDTIVVGASNDDEVLDGAGAAYVYVLNVTGTEWSEQAKLTGDETMNEGPQGSSLGWSVSINRDNTIVAGAPFEDKDGERSVGAAHVFRRGGPLEDTWFEEDKLTASDGAGGDFFGEDVGISGENVAVVTPFPKSTTYRFTRDIKDAWQDRGTLLEGGERVDISGVSVVRAMVDDVAVYELPEPSSSALYAAGLSALSLLFRRRRARLQ